MLELNLMLDCDYLQLQRVIIFNRVVVVSCLRENIYDTVEKANEKKRQIMDCFTMF